MIAQRQLAVLLCTAALLLKLLVPAGWMIDPAGGWPGIMPCPQAAAVASVAADHHAMVGHDHAPPSESSPPAKELPCAFAGLAAALTAINPFLLAGLIAFVMALVAAGRPVVLPERCTRIRPPLRAPPAYR